MKAALSKEGRAAAHISCMEPITYPAPADGRIVIAGDWHGNTAWMRRALRSVHDAGHELIIHVGDLQVLWPYDVAGPMTPEQYALMPAAGDLYEFTWQLGRLLEKYGITMLFVDGNHDNHPALRALPREEHGFGVISDRLKYLPRGHRFTIGGVRFGALGGAYSINRARLTRGASWWPEEVVESADVTTLGTGALDVLIAHEVPAGITLAKAFDLPDAIERESYVSRLLLREAVRNTEPSLVFSGHWHQRLTSRLPFTGTEVHVLDRDGSPENLAVLDLAAGTVAPLPL